MQLPNGIAFNQTKKDVEAKLTDEFTYNAGTYSYFWNYSEYKTRSFSVEVNVSVDTNKVSKISVRNDTWNY